MYNVTRTNKDYMYNVTMTTVHVTRTNDESMYNVTMTNVTCYKDKQGLYTIINMRTVFDV